jgi:hypothetical protein
MKMPDRTVCSVLFAIMALGFFAEARAGLVNDVPSCYAVTHIKPAAMPYDKLIYILIDQTVKLTPDLEQSVVNNALRMVQPGSKFVIAEFSAFSQGRYLEVIHTGIEERPLAASRVDSTPIRAAHTLRRCLTMQAGFARRMVATTVARILKESKSTLDQSDIMLALKTVSKAIRTDPAQEKVVFVVTDGLENSSVTSFYMDNSVRNIDPSTEIAKAAAAHLFGNFGGASVYILGGAMMPPASNGTRAQRDGYRDPTVLGHLKAFWREYFTRSGACLVEFGEPALTRPVSYVNPQCKAAIPKARKTS